MPKNDDAEMAVCDGCGMERDDVSVVAFRTNATDGSYCPECAERRMADPIVTIQGRTLLYSELEAQAEDDEHLAAALEGDSIQDQIKAAKAGR